MPRSGPSPARGRGSARRADQAHRGGRRRSNPVAASPRVGPGGRLTWARRIGIIGGLVLVGVSVAFAAQALGPPDVGSSAHPSGSSSPPVDALLAGLAPPVLYPTAQALTRADGVAVSGTLAGNLPANGPFKVRIYVNDQLRADERIARRDTEFSVASVPLVEGTNSITATIAGPYDETGRSAAITVERDATPPRIQISSPAGSVVYGENVLINGTTEAGATVSALDKSTSAQASTSAGDGGAFSILLPLRPGSNALELTAVDLAGNTGHKSMTVSRQESQAAITLNLSRDEFELASLPETISMVAHVLGPNGQPLDGAAITFSISPPGQMTVTHNTTTDGSGDATWSDYPLSSDLGLTGQGLVTVLATLPGGQTLAESASFSLR